MKCAKLKEKRHFIHEGKLPFWEKFEQYLMDTYECNPTKHHLVCHRSISCYKAHPLPQIQHPDSVERPLMEQLPSSIAVDEFLHD